MSVLITGAKGMLGTDLCTALRYRDVAFDGIDIEEANLVSEAAAVTAIRSRKPKVIVHTAAYTRVDDAENDADGAYLVNARASHNVALGAREVDAMVIAISTDYVYDGTKTTPYVEDDTVNPLSVYGRTKLAGENKIRQWKKHIVLRTEWLYGRHGPNFVKTMLKLAEDRPYLEVVTDQRGAPTYTSDLSECIADIVVAMLNEPDPAKYGIYHIAAAGSCSWHDFACRIMELSGKSIEVRPTTSDKFRRPAPRPTNSVLDCSKLRDAFGVSMPPWEEGLKRYIVSGVF